MYGLWEDYCQLLMGHLKDWHNIKNISIYLGVKHIK